MSKHSEVVNPLWLRMWHGVHAATFILLVLTGFSMHYASEPWSVIPFSLAVRVHNYTGVFTIALWCAFFGLNFLTGNARHYIPKDWHLFGRFLRQVRYYAIGMFRGARPPYPPGFRKKFNPAQQLAYSVVMYVLMPLSCISGSLLLMPVLLPHHAFGRGGLWPVAMVHLGVGFVLSLFLLVHVYLATTGENVGTLYKEMFTGVRTSEPPPPMDET